MKLRPEKVYFCFPSGGNPSIHFLASVALLFKRYPKMEFNFSLGSRIAKNRNNLVRSFLASKCDWMWMVDDDMVIPTESLSMLMEVADVEKVPVVSGLAFADDRGVPFSTIMVKHPSVDGYIRAGSWPPSAVQPVDATGAACLLVHRWVLEKMGQRFFEYKPSQWFMDQTVNGKDKGEDVVFCERLAKMDIPIHVHTGVKLGHVKEKIITELEYRRTINDRVLIASSTSKMADFVTMALNALRIPCLRGPTVEGQERAFRFVSTVGAPYETELYSHVWLGDEMSTEWLWKKLLSVGVNRDLDEIDAVLRSLESPDAAER